MIWAIELISKLPSIPFHGWPDPSHLSLSSLRFSTCGPSQSLGGWLPCGDGCVSQHSKWGPSWWDTGSHATSLLSCCPSLPRVKGGEAHIFITLQACRSAPSEGHVAVCTLRCRELHQGNALRRISRRLGYRWSGSLPLNYLSLVISSKSLAVHWWSSIIEALPRARARFSGARAGAVILKAVRQPPGRPGSPEWLVIRWGYTF